MESFTSSHGLKSLQSTAMTMNQESMSRRSLFKQQENFDSTDLSLDESQECVLESETIELIALLNNKPNSRKEDTTLDGTKESKMRRILFKQQELVKQLNEENTKIINENATLREELKSSEQRLNRMSRKCIR